VGTVEANVLSGQSSPGRRTTHPTTDTTTDTTEDRNVRSWSPRRWVAAIAGAIVVALAIGLPTELIPNPLFHRMMPTIWWNYPVWIATSVVSGLLLATYVREAGADPGRPSRRGGVGGLLAFFAVGCPVCNKLVVVALGTSGAMSWFAPVQPYLGMAGLALLAVALRGRLRGADRCAVPVADGQVGRA
jgi:hypothetical protein